MADICFSVLPSTGDLIYILDGEHGYHISGWNSCDRARNERTARYYNEQMDITEEMEIRIVCESMRGKAGN